MNVVCLDLEGVLVPEIWIAFAEEAGIPELKRTTRDEPDYDKLMKWRLDVLAEHGLGLPDVQATIAKIDPMPGARAFLDELRSLTQVIIISDTFEQFAKPLMEKLGWPTLFCNELIERFYSAVYGVSMYTDNGSLTVTSPSGCWFEATYAPQPGDIAYASAEARERLRKMLVCRSVHHTGRGMGQMRGSMRN